MGANAGMTPPAEVLDQRYPARRILDLIGSRWTPVVLYCLSQEVGRFNEMQRRIPDISKKMLTHTLRDLERKGLVRRDAHPDDGRRILIVADPEAAFREMAPLFGAWVAELEELYGGYSDPELRVIADFMHKAAARQSALTTELAEETSSPR